MEYSHCYGYGQLIGIGHCGAALPSIMGLLASKGDSPQFHNSTLLKVHLAFWETKLFHKESYQLPVGNLVC